MGKEKKKDKDKKRKRDKEVDEAHKRAKAEKLVRICFERARLRVCSKAILPVVAVRLSNVLRNFSLYL